MLATAFLLLVHTYVAVSATSTFVVPHRAGQDDTPTLMAGLANHSSNSTILFQRGVTYNIFTPLKFPFLNNVNIQIEGNLTYPTDIPTIQGMYGRPGLCVAYLFAFTAAIVASSVRILLQNFAQPIFICLMVHNDRISLVHGTPSTFFHFKPLIVISQAHLWRWIQCYPSRIP